MMELRICALVVTLSVVTATPYGYGVKGGAGASSAALSSASAGAFGGHGDIPSGQLPYGPGFSGSFSKSSSSSSSSSSASSSSSSSSFSYNGSGAGGVPGYGNVGCTGGCQSSGANDVSANHEGSGAGHDGTSGTGAGHHGTNGNGAGHHGTTGTGAGHNGYNGANTGAGAGLDAPSGAGCQGPTCDGYSGKCSNGQCQLTSQTAASPSCWDGKCTSGQLRATPQTGPSSSPYDDSDDIPFVAHTTKSAQDARDQSTNHDKTSQYNAGSHCAGGNCGSSTTHNGYPSGATPSYHEPSKHLETPKEGPGCQSGSCRPSSYNVPIHGNYDAKPQCANGICNNPQKGSYSPTTGDTLSTNYLSPHDIQSTKSPSYSYSDSPGCVGSSCGPVPSSQTGGRPSSILTPSSCTSLNCKPHYSPSATTVPNVQPGQDSQTGPTHGSSPTGPVYGNSPSGCTTPNCFNQASFPGATPQSNYGGKPSGDAPGHEQPTYTGGFGGPAGMLTPNEYNVPTSVTSKPVHSSSPSYITQSDTSTNSCKTPGCLGAYPSAGATASSTAQSGSYGADKHTDSVTISGDKLPSYTGGFGGSAGMLKPDNYDIQVTNKPVYSSNPTYNSHPYTAPLGRVTLPSTSVDSSSELPAYTGGFGGPAGFLKPNEYDVHHTTSNGQNPSYASVSPSKTPSNNLAGCSTPNCHSSSDISKHPSHPTHDVSISSPISPGFTTNYIGPIGVTYPSASPVAPISATDAYNLPHHPAGSYSAGCRAGNCGRPSSTGLPSGNAPSGSYDHSHPSTQVKPSGPQHTGGYGGFSSTNTPNYHSQTTPNVDSSSTNCKNGNCPTGNVATDAHPASSSGSQQELPSYTSGFGGPSGLLNPGDYSIPATGLSPSHEKPSTGTHAPGTAGTCTSGSCSPKGTSSSLPVYNGASGAGAHASASASANAVAYSGGFGGPPGLLAPYDDGKVDLAKVAGGHHQGSNNGVTNVNSHEKPGAHGTNTGSLAGSAAGATAYSGAGASSGSYGYNPHGAHQPASNTKGGSPCGGGCSGGYQDGLNGNSAAGSTGYSNSGALGFGGSYASSSASAHASSGAYTKGGYGKR